MEVFKSKLIGKTAYITDKESDYYGHYGQIILYDGDYYHISGGSIATSYGIELAPIFDRNQFKVKREKKY